MRRRTIGARDISGDEHALWPLPKYRHTVSVITAKNHPHTFLSMCSYLLLEEQYNKEHAKSATHHALLAASSSRPAAPTSGLGAIDVPRSSQPTVDANTSFNNRGNKKRHGHGNNFPSSSSGGAPPS